jgi:hypothetical protein
MLRNKSWGGMLTAAAVMFGALVIGCGPADNPAGGGGAALNGTWVSSEEGMILYLNNGSFEISAEAGTFSDKDVKMIKGSYKTSSGSNISLTPAQIHGDIINVMLLGEFEDMEGIENLIGSGLDSKWYTRSELKPAMKKMLGIIIYAMMGGDGAIDELFDELATPRAGTYVLNGNTLTITFEDDGPTTFTRK